MVRLPGTPRLFFMRSSKAEVDLKRRFLLPFKFCRTNTQYGFMKSTNQTSVPTPSRPVAWEDDISRNTLDNKPFENLLPVSDLPASEFANPKPRAVLEPLLDEPLEDCIARDTYPIPAPKDREGYNPDYDGTYWLSGLEDYLKVMQVARRFEIEPRAVFDFGCASGRLIRHYAAQTAIPEIWGSDINHRHIRWLYEYMPSTVKPIFNHCLPTLPLADHSIDIITAFSVFTHIDTFETCWLAELRRILSPNGVAYLTVHNEATWEILREHVDNPKNRLIQSIMETDPSVREKIMEPMPADRLVYRFTNSGPYRAQVFHSNDYLRPPPSM